MHFTAVPQLIVTLMRNSELSMTQSVSCGISDSFSKTSLPRTVPNLSMITNAR